jgi:hypothetical protein
MAVSDDADAEMEVPVDAYLSEAFTALDLIPLDAATTGSLGDYAQRLDLVRRVIEVATVLRNHLELAVIEAMPTKHETAGGLRIVREPQPRSTWKDNGSSAQMRNDIEREVATKLAMDYATGDVDPERRNLIMHAIHELWDVLPAPSMMKASSRRFGLRIGDYRNFTTGYSIKLLPEEEPNA